jgi:hypothetical protein
MSLDPKRITELLAKPARGGQRKVVVITRDYQGWFKCAQKLIDDETGELADCENPNCQDPRHGTDKSVVVTEINGKKMCRYCFLEGWLKDE